MNISSKKDTEINVKKSKSAAISKRIKGKTPSRGILWRITEPYREWRDLPKQIQTCPDKSEKHLLRINDMLIDYRLSLMKSTHMAKNVNQHIWQLYHQVNSKNENLLKETNKKALYLNTSKYLKHLLASWEDLLSTQEELIDSISRAPASLKFYNMMMTYKEIRQQERIHDEANERYFNEAYNSLEGALEYVEEFFNRSENNFFKTSRILDLDNARQFWSEKLSEINEMQQSGRTEIKTILSKINNLKNIIFEAPTMAKRINDIEQRFIRISDDHELLKNMYGRTIINADEIHENTVLITDVIPKLWVTGDNKQLNYYLLQLDTFLNGYETSLQEELAYQERHSPWAGMINGAKEGDEIDMLTSFVKIMINAIESRESHMGDHSNTVARLSRGTAEVLGWSLAELKFLEIAGLLHDVGKIWIPETLLSKPGPLTDNEYQVLRMHPFYSAKIVESISALKDIVPWVLYHHERWDGKGYPEALKKDEIPLGASIIAVAEAFSAMIFNTLSRQPLTIDQAFEQIREESGKQFDPDVTEAFIEAANGLREDLENSRKNGFSSII